MTTLEPVTAPDDLIAGRYHLRRRVGGGASGDVWLAEDRELGRDVAVKRVRIPDELAGEDRQRARLRVLREARAAARLDHPNVARVYDVLEEDAEVAIVMAYIEAPTLQERVDEQGALSDDEAAALAASVLDVLETAHERGVVHRDVKPSNLLVSPEGVKVTDFGIAAVTDETELTRTGTALGSPAYMAPEQASGGDVGPAADLWGLGATLYFALEGRPPFDRGRAVATVHAVVHDEPAAPRTDSPLHPVIWELLAKDPAARPGVSEARRRLRQALDGSGESVEATRALGSSAATQVMSDRGAPAASTDEHATSRDAPVQGHQHDLETRRVGAPTRQREADPERTAAKRDSERTGRVVGWLIAGVFALVLGALVWFWVAATDGGSEPSVAPTSTGGRSPTAPVAGGDTAPDDESAQNGDTEDERAEETAPPATEEPPVPEDWQVFEGPVYSVAHPPSWEAREASGPRIDLTDPETGSYLRVDHTDEPKSDPVADWERQSEAFADEHAGYEEIRIEAVDYRDYDAALWEYRYEVDGQRFHAYNLGFTDGECGYALNLQAPAERWDDMEPLFETFMASFEAKGC